MFETACFYLDGAASTAIVDALFGPINDRMKNVYRLKIDKESYHSLTYFLRYLIERRRQLGKPYDPALESELLHRIDMIYRIWWIEMRYHPDVASLIEAQIVLDEASWVQDNHERLWR